MVLSKSCDDYSQRMSSHIPCVCKVHKKCMQCRGRKGGADLSPYRHANLAVEVLVHFLIIDEARSY